jgi:ParB-like chromosome segregation protein Spo0J
MEAKIQAVEMVPIDELRPHPRNYRVHPEDQLAHVEHSMRTNGVYRNVVAARDGTILAGHGVVLAARKIGLAEVPVDRLRSLVADRISGG